MTNEPFNVPQPRRKVLHLLTREGDGLADQTVALQRSEAGLEVATVDLTKGGVDYTAVAEAIFEADSIQVW